MSVHLLQEVLEFIERQQELICGHIDQPNNAQEYQDIYSKIAGEIINGIRKNQEQRANDDTNVQEEHKEIEYDGKSADSGLDVEEDFIKLLEEEEINSRMLQNGVSVLQSNDNLLIVKDISNETMNKTVKENTKMTKNDSSETCNKDEPPIIIKAHKISNQMNTNTTISRETPVNSISQNHAPLSPTVNVVDSSDGDNCVRNNPSPVINVVDSDGDDYVPNNYNLKTFAVRSDYQFRPKRKLIDLTAYLSDEETETDAKKKQKQEILLSYKCELCGDSFKEPKLLKEHVEKHNAKVLYSCKVCQQLFPYLSNLRQHIVRHKKERERENHTSSNGQKHPAESYNNQSRKKLALNKENSAGTNYSKHNSNKNCNFSDYMKFVSHLNKYRCRICKNSYVEKRYVKMHIKEKHL